MNLWCFTQASPPTTEHIAPDLLCEFGVVYLKSDGASLITNKQANAHIHTYNIR